MPGDVSRGDVSESTTVVYIPNIYVFPSETKQMPDDVSQNTTIV